MNPHRRRVFADERREEEEKDQKFILEKFTIVIKSGVKQQLTSRLASNLSNQTTNIIKHNI